MIWISNTIAGLIILFTLYDVLVTTLSHSGAGPITDFWTRWVWRATLFSKYRFNSERIIRNIGPVILIGIILVWYALLYLAWSFLFASQESLQNSTDPVISLLDVLYFIGSTFGTLGMGDYRPTGFPWTIFTTLGAFMVSGIISLAISYLVPVLSAVVERRKLVTTTDALGETTEDLMSQLSGTSLDSYILNLSDQLFRTSYQAQDYPVLDYFYFGRSHSALNAAVRRLWDVLIIQKALPNRKQNLSKSVIDLLLRAIAEYEKNLLARFQEGSIKKFRTDHSSLFQFAERERVRSVSAICAEDLQENLKGYLKIREHLLAFTHYEGRLKSEGNLLSDKEIGKAN